MKPCARIAVLLLLCAPSPAKADNPADKRVVNVICILSPNCGSVAAQPGASDTTPDIPFGKPTSRPTTNQQVQTAAQGMGALRTEVTATYTSSPLDSLAIAAAQVVLKKVQRSGWAILKKKVQELARCDNPAAKLPHLCPVVDTLTIQDLIASPRVLLDAAVTDLLQVVLAKLQLPKAVKAAIGVVAVAWGATGFRGASDALKAELLKELNASLPDECAKAQSEKEKLLYIVATCLATKGGTDYLTCDFAKLATDCGITTESQKNEVTAAAMAAGRMFASDADTKAHAMIQLFFALIRISESDVAAKAQVDLVETIFIGFIDRDWVKTVSAASQLLGSVKSDGTSPMMDPKLLALIAAVGEYSTTFKTNDAAAAAAAREKVIEDLVERMVSRAERESTLVASIGGSLSLLAGAKRELGGDNSELAPPVHLTLGFGLQSYPSANHTYGFHLSVDFIDLGQYVTYSSAAGDLELVSPDVQSSLIIGGTVGAWFLSRETPVFIGVHIAASPFVKTTNNKVTYDVGLQFGMYIPLLDFN